MNELERSEMKREKERDAFILLNPVNPSEISYSKQDPGSGMLGIISKFFFSTLATPYNFNCP